jgi:hypothetical protein
MSSRFVRAYGEERRPTLLVNHSFDALRLVRADGRLHDTVEAQERTNQQLPHCVSPVDLFGDAPHAPS